MPFTLSGEELIETKSVEERRRVSELVQQRDSLNKAIADYTAKKTDVQAKIDQAVLLGYKGTV